MYKLVYSYLIALPLFNCITLSYSSTISMFHKDICNETFEWMHFFSRMLIISISDIYVNILLAPTCAIQSKIQRHNLLPIWQYLPKYPGWHLHFHLLPTRTQLPPFWHPLKIHESARDMQCLLILFSYLQVYTYYWKWNSYNFPSDITFKIYCGVIVNIYLQTN